MSEESLQAAVDRREDIDVVVGSNGERQVRSPLGGKGAVQHPLERVRRLPAMRHVERRVLSPVMKAIFERAAENAERPSPQQPSVARSQWDH